MQHRLRERSRANSCTLAEGSRHERHEWQLKEPSGTLGNAYWEFKGSLTFYGVDFWFYGPKKSLLND
jgi:hypothetical protein